jgi:phage gp36-like protein
MKTLIASTEDFIKLERGVLGADLTAGSNISTNVGNNDGLAQNDYIVIGYEGSELAELEQINAAVTAGTTVQLATVKFAHKAGEPWVKYSFNKRKFYGATSATGTFTELVSDGSPVDIQVDDPQGCRLEYTGSTYTYFKSTYYNSTLTEETDIDDAIAVLADESARYCSLYAIRKHAGLYANPFYSDLRIEMKRKQAENEIDSMIYARYTLPLTEIPAILSYICELLAAGYIDYEEFGKDGEGVRWLGEARSILKDIKNGTRILIGSDGVEEPRRENVGRLAGLPNDTDTTDADQGYMFTRDQVM